MKQITHCRDYFSNRLRVEFQKFLDKKRIVHVLLRSCLDAWGLKRLYDIMPKGLFEKGGLERIKVAKILLLFKIK